MPGTIGGALRMNAGAYGRETKDVLIEAEALDAHGVLLRLTVSDMGFSYRHSDVPEDWIFTGARLQGRRDDPAAIAARMAEIGEIREDSQPVRTRTGGSTFKNPPGAKAWELIDRAGCRGLTRGKATVSDKHTNFLINTGGATAADIEGLGEEVRRRVMQSSGIALEWEIRIIGVPLAARTSHEPPSHILLRRAARAPKPWRRRRMSKTVTVLMGGWSSEREVSLSSGENVARALAEQGYVVHLHDIRRDLGSILAALTPRPDVVFNALHGRYGEDGCIQGVLEVLGIPYTHSGVMASALAMNKPMAKKLFVDAGLPCAEGRVVKRDELLKGDPMPRPYVVKPLNEGSSVGVAIVHERAPGFDRKQTGPSATRCWSSASSRAARSPSPSWATARSARPSCARTMASTTTPRNTPRA